MNKTVAVKQHGTGDMRFFHTYIQNSNLKKNKKNEILVETQKHTTFWLSRIITMRLW